MKQKNLLAFIAVILLGTATGHCQGVNIDNGASLTINGPATLNINNASLINNGAVSSSGGTVSFTGTTSATWDGTGTAQLFDLTINKSLNSLTLGQNVSIVHNVNLVSEHIDLNGYSIDLGSTGNLVGENNASYVGSSGFGTITASAVLNAPVAVNPGSLGAIISSPANMGLTVVTRGHEQLYTLLGGIGIARHYGIAPVNNSALDATLTFSYLDHELSGIPEPSLVTWYSEDGGITWDSIGASSFDQANNLMTVSNVPSMELFTLGDRTINPLPLHLLSFTGRLINDDAQLEWRVAGEQNISAYEVERSADGTSYNYIGVVPATGSDHYQFTDKDPFMGKTWYRLRIKEQGGNDALSNVVTLFRAVGSPIHVYPNPVTDKVTIEFYSSSAGPVSLRLTDAAGHTAAENSVTCMPGLNRAVWNIESFAQGTYYLSIEGIITDAIPITKF